MKILTGGAGLLALALTFVPACKKSEGATCYEPSDCAEGLACKGDDVRRCESCADSDICKSDGRCSASEGKCTAASDEDCKKAFICTGKGACTASKGACTVGGDADCKQSEACAKDGFCKAKGNNCIKDAKAEPKKEEEKPKEAEEATP
jgi:hypothetical protein